MNFTPAQVDEMSPWEFIACIEGHNRAHGGGKPQPPTEEEFDAVVSRMVH